MPTLSMPFRRQSHAVRSEREASPKHRRRSEGFPSSLHLRAWVCLLVLSLMITAPAFGLPFDGIGQTTLKQAAIGLWEALVSWVDGIVDVLAEVPEPGETHDMGFEIEPNG